MLARPPPWTRDYIGIPFAPHGRDRTGCDCWGLVRLVLRERFGLRLPSYADAYAGAGLAEAEDNAAALRHGAGAERWRRLDPGSARAGDVALLRLAGTACHVGVIVGWPWMLHVETGTDAAVERLDALRWARRLDSVWRHPALVP